MFDAAATVMRTEAFTAICDVLAFTLLVIAFWIAYVRHRRALRTLEVTLHGYYAGALDQLKGRLTDTQNLVNQHLETHDNLDQLEQRIERMINDFEEQHDPPYEQLQRDLERNIDEGFDEMKPELREELRRELRDYLNEKLEEDDGGTSRLAKDIMHAVQEHAHA